MTPRADDVTKLIVESMERVLRAADHLVNEYTRKDGGFGTGVGMRAAEDVLIARVREWRRACGADPGPRPQP